MAKLYAILALLVTGILSSLTTAFAVRAHVRRRPVIDQIESTVELLRVEDLIRELNAAASRLQASLSRLNTQITSTGRSPDPQLTRQTLTTMERAGRSVQNLITNISYMQEEIAGPSQGKTD